MTTIQIKSEIRKLLDTMPDKVLQELLDYLKEVQQQTKGQEDLKTHLHRIMKEDRELLEKLAL